MCDDIMLIFRILIREGRSGRGKCDDVVATFCRVDNFSMADIFSE
jgi:hypothetical protein